ncbi:uncharacterized protein LOC131038573 isoform X2 [Cryptomeria japonica]|uniref:uncharacterized protein LOC131038573 isoform X2 n=1 Tax=Cryptomeria japonica TaxID=3369 RepID=UPI0027DA4E53|nr:uncharacterized protein LOC131038573 isoform X2 [Cryptomeria japonica]
MANRGSNRYQSNALPNIITTPMDGRSSVSSHHSDSSCTTVSSGDRRGSSVKRLVKSLSNRYTSSPSTSKDKSFSSSSSRKELPTSKASSAIVKTKSCISPCQSKGKPDHPNMTSLVKKFMDTKAKPLPHSGNCVVIPADFIAQDLKKASAKANKFKSLQEKLLHKVSGKSAGSHSQKKMLTDSKVTRPLSVVLKSEQELLQQNREYQIEIEELQTVLASKNAEVEGLRSLGIMLKELCSKQQNEIKALKSSFPSSKKDSSQLHELLEKQGTELKQARLVIPSLQEQVTSLTEQLKSLAEGLAEVKADKDAMKAYFDGHVATPKTPVFNQEAENFNEICTSEPTTPVSQEDMMLKDMNPCLTPYYARTKSQELEVIGYGLTDEEQLAEALHKLVIGSEQKQDVLQEHCINVLRKSISFSTDSTSLNSGAKLLRADENRLGFSNLHCKAPNQKLCWD